MGAPDPSRDRLLAVLIGLAKACDVGCKTDSTDSLILSALSAAAGQTADLAAITKRVLDEKDLVSPGCSICETPCGNTDSYDLCRINSDPDDVRREKHAILDGICRLFREGYVDTGDAEFLRRCLCAISEDVPAGYLVPFVNAIERKLHQPES